MITPPFFGSKFIQAAWRPRNSASPGRAEASEQGPVKDVSFRVRFVVLGVRFSGLGFRLSGVRADDRL